MNRCKECSNFQQNYGISAEGVSEKPHGMCICWAKKEKLQNENDYCENYKQRKIDKFGNEFLIIENQKSIQSLLITNNMLIDRYLKQTKTTH